MWNEAVDDVGGNAVVLVPGARPAARSGKREIGGINLRAHSGSVHPICWYDFMPSGYILLLEARCGKQQSGIRHADDSYGERQENSACSE